MKTKKEAHKENEEKKTLIKVETKKEPKWENQDGEKSETKEGAK